jgi:periplasmic divalent cation tolerance protein
MVDIILCFVTAPSQEVASALAKLVVDRELAACVNIIPGVQSVYRWKGEVTLDEEVLMVIKTSKHRVQELEQLIIAEHPYETPEFVALTPSSVSDAYSKWVLASTGG